ncbi:type I-G CRISPR-associated helicase/endonuclease Cas3g [Acidipropionibacterium virtanenii]|uniref:CRISPR-associated nuclease/helicase Cas3 n=1 Tax=Acidipropionibacterium virtanenii TaxID=2057246 RepID=A0A344UR00_9ACTN|nr:type I-U CRISPR-associated helicase/endonuclease Cas3 [Acidipropionibacterium virtanenii]AXE37698.1 Putative CRISPR-associated nuclease/helicase Cas3 [Acidipropionibacterium virtanenii]
MTLTISDFPRFFAEINDHNEPFPWQVRLVDTIFEQGRWPDAITAPTGSGKSAVVEAHIFLAALSAAGSGPRLPRRLCVVVDRRALVDSQADRAQRVLDWLTTSADPLAQEMTAALASITIAPDSGPVILANLRGGIASDRTWIDDPSACAVICATPDMWGSRLLMRGYGTSRAARPREAGLLGMDSVVVIDEAHLSRQLLGTARWVSRYVAKTSPTLGVPGLQVVESSATARTDNGGTEIGISAEDLEYPGLEPRMTRPKPVRIVRSPDWNGRKATAKYLATLATEARLLRETRTGGTIGCIVNNVNTALRLAEELGDNCPCWVGPMRPMDLARLKAQFPDLFGIAGRQDRESPQFLVATQTVEVGIDVDFVGLLTELAPADSLAQRFGRVNRKGSRHDGPITVIGPDESAVKDQLPYVESDLRNGDSWLAQLTGTGDARPQHVMDVPPPSKSPEREIVKLPHPGDAMRWEATADTLLADEELELWIRDSLRPDQLEGGLVIRGPLPDDDALVLPLLDATSPIQDEVFPVTLWRLRQVVLGILTGNGSHARAFVLRNDEVSSVVKSDDDTVDIRSGDVVFIDTGHAVTRKGVVVDDATRPEGDLETGWGAVGTQVIMDGDRESHWLTDLCGLDDDDAQEEFLRSGGIGVVTRGPDVVEGVRLAWIVVRPPGAIEDNESIRQLWTRSGDLVTLADHQEGVADRATNLADSIGLASEAREALSVAGLHHDDGKSDQRFQRYRLNAPNDAPVLAKSPARSAQAASRRRWSGGLPRGWRHELRSVAVAWPVIEESNDPELVARLIGTSHGHGRVLPQLDAPSLINDCDDEALKERIMDLFVSGEWCSLMSRTSWRLGAWTCCYLEAVLRAADCRVSKEGS